MKKVLVVFGTRPEAIKMCPLILELKQNKKHFKTYVCVTGQHKEMLDQVMSVFNVIPDFNLSIMKENQTLVDITSSILIKMDDLFKMIKPDIVLVHGDTTTTFSTSLSAFYNKVSVGHVEAGLRTYNLNSPYPEEFNRQSVGLLSDYHFAATSNAKQNLINEGKDENSIFVTGNTVIDALKTTVDVAYTHPELEWANGSRLILVTAHRRENIGQPLINICRAILSIVSKNSDVKVIFPVHPNPKIKDIVVPILGEHENIHLIPPLEVIDFHNFISSSYFVMSDSGGIQEEAPSLGKPVLVLRNTTERPEGVKAGTLKLIGTKKEDIEEFAQFLLNDQELYNKMSKASNPYGDGKASQRIVEVLKSI